MRKFLLLALASGFIFTSCSNDDDNDQEVSILGTWKHTQLRVFSGKDGSVLSNNIQTDCDKKTTSEFTSNGIIKSNFYEFYNNSCNHYYDELDYSFNKNTMKLISDGQEFTIKSLTQNEMVMDDPEYDDDYNNDGFPDVYEVHLTR